MVQLALEKRKAGTGPKIVLISSRGCVSKTLCCYPLRPWGELKLLHSQPTHLNPARKILLQYLPCDSPFQSKDWQKGSMNSAESSHVSLCGCCGRSGAQP